jgi:hypothetical protein
MIRLMPEKMLVSGPPGPVQSSFFYDKRHMKNERESLMM